MNPSNQMIFVPVMPVMTFGAPMFIPQFQQTPNASQPSLGDDGGSGNPTGGTNIGGAKSGLGFSGLGNNLSQGQVVIGWIPVYGSAQAQQTSSASLGTPDGGSENPTNQGTNIGNPKSGLGYGS